MATTLSMLSTMDPLFALFTHTVNESKPNKLVLALSGGIDSRVLLDLLRRYKQQYPVPCLAVHVHHGLSSNADNWAAQCVDWCQQSEIELRVERVQLDLAGRSIEESAREARYQALAKHLQPGDVLLTGQHSDDQLETFLLALKRGSGPKGLSAMAKQMPFASASMLRPLLCASRTKIEQYAQEHQLAWVEDESNQDTRFERNFIRHQVAPILQQRWPHFSKSVQRSSELCAEQEALLQELLQDKLEQAMCEYQSLSVEVLATFSERVRSQIIRQWLAKLEVKMPSREHLVKIWQEVALAREDANPLLNLGDGQIRRFEQRLYWVTEVQDISSWHQSISLDETVALPDGLGEITLRLQAGGFLAADTLQDKNLSIIFDPQGLSAHPVGRGHSRKLKKLFQEYGVPSWQRRRLRY
ncbi:tRNA(Ile)-lysidine synthetase [Vibrio ponticus]|nr:tRNA(Ile)-lysidine synthetase [Vibrio ponticus]